MRRPSWIGFLILAIGILFILSQLHVIVVTHSILRPGVLWPLVLVVIGLAGLKGTHGKLPLWSIFLVVVGLTLAVRNADWLPVLQQTNGWNLFWGLLIVFLGLQLLLPKRWRKRHHVRIQWHNGDKKKQELDVDGYAEESSSWQSGSWKASRGYQRVDDVGAVNRKWIGDLSIGQHSWVLKDMALWNGIGDVRLNLGTASMEPGTYHISVGGWIGDVRILVPEGLPVQVMTNLGLGDVTVFGDNHSGMRPSLDYADPEFEGADTRVHITIDLKIGDVQVVRV